MTKKKVIYCIAALLLLVGIITVGIIAYAPGKKTATPCASDHSQVSEYFYLQIYNSDSQIVSKYKITLTGMFSSANREISSVSFSHVFGDICETNYNIDDDTASVTIWVWALFFQ